MVVWVFNDTWNGLVSIAIPTHLAPGDLAAVKMGFKPVASPGLPLLELTSSNGGISIIDSVNWTFRVNPGRYSLPVGKYVWQIECEDTSSPSYIQTYLEGTGEVLRRFTSNPPSA